VNELQDLLERAADDGTLADAHDMYEGAHKRSHKVRVRRRVTAAVSSACAIALIAGGVAAVAHDGSSSRHLPVNVAHPAPLAVQHYEVDASVLENGQHGPELCLGGMYDSLPPLCSGLPIPNWDWSKVTGIEDVGGTKWGDFHLVGTYDGTSFTLTAPATKGRAATRPAAMPDFSTPCTAPAGGWNVVDASKVALADYLKLAPAAEAEPDFGGAWIDRPAGAGIVDDPKQDVMNFTFTGDLERHRAELAQIWGGPICVSQTDISHAERQRIQQALIDDRELHAFGAFSDETSGVVTANVVLATSELQHKVDAEFGAGRVKLVGELKPVG
jgi:hypothetical protein